MSESCLRDFRDLKLIGKGSFGRVYRCIRVSDGQEYAMKEVAIKAMSQREREDAVNEVRILASVNHAMVIRFYPLPAHTHTHDIFRYVMQCLVQWTIL